MAANARRVFVAVWMVLGILGALNQTIVPQLFGSRADLLLPHLAYGHDMFHTNPRRVPVARYARADGVEHDLADLVETPSVGYKRSRTALNLMAHRDYLRELCFRAVRGTHDQLTLVVDEYQVDADARRPSTSYQMICDAHGIQPR